MGQGRAKYFAQVESPNHHSCLLRCALGVTKPSLPSEAGHRENSDLSVCSQAGSGAALDPDSLVEGVLGFCFRGMVEKVSLNSPGWPGTRG